ncbi:MAG: hypothetical protein C0615_09290 [Desulfuromonas sp.]|nr:MAG: hypothetical protein C0615_09290 [Desulfuromonas sp.]
MTILVELNCGLLGEVPAAVLDRLLELDLVAGFKRSSGWAIPGRDPIRKSRAMLCFPERRAAMQELFESESPLMYWQEDRCQSEPSAKSEPHQHSGQNSPAELYSA